MCSIMGTPSLHLGTLPHLQTIIGYPLYSWVPYLTTTQSWGTPLYFWYSVSHQLHHGDTLCTPGYSAPHPRYCGTSTLLLGSLPHPRTSWGHTLYSKYCVSPLSIMGIALVPGYHASLPLNHGDPLLIPAYSVSLPLHHENILCTPWVLCLTSVAPSLFLCMLPHLRSSWGHSVYSALSTLHEGGTLSTFDYSTSPPLHHGDTLCTLGYSTSSPLHHADSLGNPRYSV